MPPLQLEAKEPAGMRKAIVLGAVVIGLTIAGLIWRGRQHADQAAAPPAATQPRPVPVVAAPVAKRDMPIYLEGLGNVIAYKIVTVKPQVEGRLDKVLFREGQAVHQGDMLAQIDPRPFRIALKQAEAALARDGAQHREAKINYDRYATLAQQKLVAQQQVDDQGALVGQYSGATQADQAAVDNAKLQLEWTSIRAPIDGVTGVRLTDPGNIIHLSDNTGIVVITQLDPIAVLFTLPEDDLTRVATQLSAGTVVVEAWSRDGNTQLGKGTLELIDNQINQTTATIRLKAIFANPKRLLWPNQFVKIRLLLTVRKDALVIPAAAVQRGPQGQFVYVVGADQTVTMRPVNIDTVEGDFAIVQKGVAPDEQVVVEGQTQLRPGAKVLPRGPQSQPKPVAGAPRSGGMGGGH
jgi:multidrug efflux system membrane fusion protein